MGETDGRRAQIQEGSKSRGNDVVAENGSNRADGRLDVEARGADVSRAGEIDQRPPERRETVSRRHPRNLGLLLPHRRHGRPLLRLRVGRASHGRQRLQTRCRRNGGEHYSFHRQSPSPRPLHPSLTPTTLQDAPYRATVLEPIGKLCSYWPEVNNTISKRNKKVTFPLIPYRSRFPPSPTATHALYLLSSSITTQPDPKRESYPTNLPTMHPNYLEQVPSSRSSPPTGPNQHHCTQAEQESETAREIFEAIDHTLRADIPVLLELRIPYLDPSLECMVRRVFLCYQP